MKSTPYEKVTERILKLMEEGVCPWKRPWNRSCLRAQSFLNQYSRRLTCLVELVIGYLVCSRA
ncbi:ArdC-like ssDNA-binding domain-containing protein [Cerasicoccus arenae]